ncbi:thioredoxin-like fold domain-containing protein MRL7L, chloroplastic isoform X1 [Nicotiana tomentosiformis]|uniref:thioredoxin-like fold domain-containing protein MRL7L, chloroplastic isoform X1 n=2 Tax=Nicotiana tomentosiformis TaxID=4098 RepID=UPI00051BB6B5|nr:thioredoxin-like fold domain-containing protein MRL7L, chloroplastic isoform X1 [Nicotiana tomentosiformis]
MHNPSKSMELQHSLRLQLLAPPLEEKCLRSFPSVFGIIPQRRNKLRSSIVSSLNLNYCGQSAPRFWTSQLLVHGLRQKGLKASKLEELLKFGNGEEDSGDDSESDGGHKRDDYFHMDEDERREWRRKIRDVIKMSPDVEEEVDLVEKRKKMQKLLADYPLVVEEEDPDWPEDADGRGFNLDQFFNKITIKNVKKDNDDDENYDSDNEVVWQDDDYIRPIKDLTTAEWEESVFKDISPLIILVHNRYKRPKENEMVRNELEKAVHIIWNCRLPSPRCVAIDAVVEVDLVSALQVSIFPELIFTKAGKIMHREKGNRTADELSKMMAFFYYGAAKPPCLSIISNAEEPIPII